MTEHEALVAELARRAQPFGDDALEPVLAAVGDARLVLVGESTHGTSEFYRLRALLTQRLIADHGFCAVCAEADWPDAYRVNRYVRGAGSDSSAAAGLGDFQRFPEWMWRNTEVVHFVEWLRHYNLGRPAQNRVGFYGLDLYSLHSSIDSILKYLDERDPNAAQRARDRYSCFEGLSQTPQEYARAADLGLTRDCEQAVLKQLLELQSQQTARLSYDGLVSDEEQFHAEQNARVVVDAERYYRAMFGGYISAWNLRDTHMADTLDALLAHLERRFTSPRVVVWAHNSHVGDARFTDMGAWGELTLGQLVRERHPEQNTLIGLTTYTGTVTAAAAWGSAAETQRVRAALPDSYEELFHAVHVHLAATTGQVWRTRDFCSTSSGGVLVAPRLQRAIGVVYRPETERQSHYFLADVCRQFDVIAHLDETRALQPLAERAPTSDEDLPETFPSGL